MAWYIYLVHFLAGAFLINAIPHTINGLSGRKFPSPFGKPPGRGESSPRLNVFWGLGNFVVGYLLLTTVGVFTVGFSLDFVVVILGASAMGLRLSTHFGHLYSPA